MPRVKIRRTQKWYLKMQVEWMCKGATPEGHFKEPTRNHFRGRGDIEDYHRPTQLDPGSPSFDDCSGDRPRNAKRGERAHYTVSDTRQAGPTRSMYICGFSRTSATPCANTSFSECYLHLILFLVLGHNLLVDASQYSILLCMFLSIFDFCEWFFRRSFQVCIFVFLLGW